MAWFTLAALISFPLPGLAREFNPATFVIKDRARLQGHFERKAFSPLGGGVQSAVYSTILQEFGPNHQAIGRGQIDQLDRGNSLSVVGGLNHVGINYVHDFIDFSVELQREVAPDLFHDERYVVVDHFHIFVDASKLMGNLQELDLLDFTQEQAAAFAGLSFKRSYRYAHYAKDFREALELNLNKLFLGFQMLNGNNYLDLAPYEFISKEDSMTVQAGMAASIPIAAGAAFQTGMMAKFYRISKTEIQAIGKEDNAPEGQRLRISFEKERGNAVMGYSALQLDFFKLLQISLFQFDFSYSYSDKYRINLGFHEQDLPMLEDNRGPLALEIASVLSKGEGDMDILHPYTISYEEHKTEVEKSKYAALIMGASKECKTSQIQISEGGKVKNFFRHTYEQVRYREGFFSRLFSFVIQSFLRLDSVVKKEMSETKSVCFEYQSEKNLIKEKEDLFLADEEEKLTLKFKQRYFSHDFDEENKQDCVDILKGCGGVDPEVVEGLESGEIRGPVKLQTNMTMNRQAIDYFNSLPHTQVYDIINAICPQERRESLRERRRDIGRGSGRRRTQVRGRSRTETCNSALRESYNSYVKELTTRNYSKKTYDNCKGQVGSFHDSRNKMMWRFSMSICMQRSSRKQIGVYECEIPLWRLKDFFEKLQSYNSRPIHLARLFGDENIFLHGSLEGKIADGGNFTSCFQDGQYTGGGVVDKYLREQNVRAPASLLIED